MEKKIIFIINSIQNQRCIKRIQEFAENGYEIHAYAFSRLNVTYTDKGFPITIIGNFSNEMSYIKRLPIISKAIKNICRKHMNGCYYLFGLDIAIAFYLHKGNKPYIYEESDLVHTYINNSIIKNLLAKIDKHIIKHSKMTVFTSMGFAYYHFGDKMPSNCHVIANRLSTKVLALPQVVKKESDNLRIGFVGKIRFESVRNFADVFCKRFPKNTFHFYGNSESESEKEMFEPLKKYKNCFFHGSFITPNDLPEIYSNIDLVLSTYDISCDNVRYAEPNKLYEAIYFETPIIVSKSTFLAKRVKDLGIGYCINAMDENEIIDFVSNLSKESLSQKIKNAASINKKEAVNYNEVFFNKLQEL